MGVELNPLDDRLIVEPIEETATPGGILLPNAANRLTARGRVLATGPGNRNADSGIREPVAVKAGDEVVFIADGGAEIEVGGERCRIVREGEVLAVKGKAK